MTAELILDTPDGPTWFEPSGRLRIYRAEDIALVILGSRLPPLPEAPELDLDQQAEAGGYRRAWAWPWQAETNRIVRTKGWARIARPSVFGCHDDGPYCEHQRPGATDAGCPVRHIIVGIADRKRGAYAYQAPMPLGARYYPVIHVGLGDLRYDRTLLDGPPTYRSRWVLLHELAHIAAGPGHGHNRTFASYLTALVTWRLGPEAGDALRLGCWHEGIRLREDIVARATSKGRTT